MKSPFKYLFAGILLSIGFFIYTGVFFDISREELETKYASGNSKFINLKNGSRIHYRDEGDITKPAIILLHGFNGSLFNFERMVPFLSSEFRLISIDLPGFGLTGPVPSKDYSTETSIKTITDVTGLLGIDRFSLAGNSMGGGVAWRYALIHPEKIESLILLASSGIYSNEQREKIRNQDSETPLAWKIMRSNFASFFLSFYTPKFFATQGLRSSIYDANLATKELSDQFHDLVLLEGSREAILSRFSNFAYQNEKPEILNEIIAPTLIIHGQEDNIIPVISSQNLATYIQNTKLIIYPEIGHLPMYESPKRVARDIETFLSRF